MPIGLGATLIAAGVLLAYANSIDGALVYDDRAAITENSTIRQLWPLWPALHAPAEAGTGGRPLANLSFAVSYAMSGLAPWGYHVINIAIHLLASLALFGVVRRTLEQPVLRPRFGSDAPVVAGGVALLWAVHPLQTQVVTYLSQRTEGLMGLFYLLTLYCFIRSTAGSPSRWQALSVLSCLLGAFCKEIIATAPVIVLLYDRTFVAGAFRKALRLRPYFYASLAAIWLLLGYLLIGVKQRGVGYDLGVSGFAYALTECKAVMLYLKLSLWPSPLIFDRGVNLVEDVGPALPYVGLLAAGLGGTIWALIRRPVLGFAGAFFFVILAPASSVIPVIQQPIAENRPYLSSAAVVGLLLGALYLKTGRRGVVVVGGVLAIAAVVATARRNVDFKSEIGLWSDTVAKCPQNARAHYNLGVALDYAGRVQEAVGQYQAAIKVAPGYADPHNNLGNALAEHGQIAQAFPYLEEAIRLRPNYIDAHYNLGNAFLNTGQLAKAAEQYQIALTLDPKQFKARNNLGVIYLKTGKVAEAMTEFESALSINPSFADPHNNLAVALSQVDRLPEAIAHCEAALRINPNYTSARENLASLLTALQQKKAQR